MVCRVQGFTVIYDMCVTRFDCYLCGAGFDLFVICVVQGLTVLYGLWGKLFDCCLWLVWYNV